MSDRFPFDDLLDAVRADGVTVGPRERLVFARFLSRYDGTSRDELRAATASLLAGSSAEIEVVKAAFDRVYPEEEPVPPPSLPPAPPLASLLPAPQPTPRKTRSAPPEQPTKWERILRWLRPRARELVLLSAAVAVVTGSVAGTIIWLRAQPSDPGSGSPSTGASTAGEGSTSTAPGEGGAGGATTTTSTSDPAGSSVGGSTTSTAPNAGGTGGVAGGSTTGGTATGGAQNDPAAICPPTAEAKLQRWPLPAALLALGTLLGLVVAGGVGGRRRALEKKRARLADRFVELPRTALVRRERQR